jgi:hypothetical protein
VKDVKLQTFAVVHTVALIFFMGELTRCQVITHKEDKCNSVKDVQTLPGADLHSDKLQK